MFELQFARGNQYYQLAYQSIANANARAALFYWDRGCELVKEAGRRLVEFTHRLQEYNFSRADLTKMKQVELSSKLAVSSLQNFGVFIIKQGATT